ncbi:MAG TPA: hypothetical protein VMP12_07095 [Candidatus Sulfotelmatobacter sp.]|nr:hypothetical protein [Candidatus Sulfotelmatobacter sp.]
MSTDMHHSAAGDLPRNEDVSFETADVHPATIYWYLGALAVAVILSYIVCVFVLRVTTKIAVDYDTPPPAVREEMGSAYDALPPEPRLQGVPGHTEDPQADLRNKRAADEKANQTTSWIDQNAGIAQIPVSEAMKIIAEKGLPGVPAAAEKK